MKKVLFLIAALSCMTMGYAADKVKTETKSVPATTSSQDIEKKNEIIHVYMDTTYTYTTRTVRNEIYQEEDTSWTRKGHYFQALVGAGYGSMGYGIKDLLFRLHNAFQPELVGKSLFDTFTELGFVNYRIFQNIIE